MPLWLLSFALAAAQDPGQEPAPEPTKEEISATPVETPPPPPAAPEPPAAEEVSSWMPGDASPTLPVDVTPKDAPVGFFAGATLEMDLGDPKEGVGLAPAIQAAWSGRDLGANLALIIAQPVGIRLDGHVHLRNRKPFRPYLLGGAAFFFTDLGLRAGAGFDWKVGPVVVLASAAYEGLLFASPDFHRHAFLLSAGAAYNWQP